MEEPRRKTTTMLSMDERCNIARLGAAYQEVFSHVYPDLESARAALEGARSQFQAGVVEIAQRHGYQPGDTAYIIAGERPN